jgi:hypothetical protein
VASKIPQNILDQIALVKNKRARIILDTIVKKGSINTDELKALGYQHPPRAARDVRELGFSLITTSVAGEGGKQIASYSLGNTMEAGKSGRAQLPKKQRDALIAAAGERCQICGAAHDLQVDHRVPYEVAGESLKDQPNAYMVLDGTCNRRKSWVCEHCPNFLRLKQVGTCQSCYWANPQEHLHAAMEPIRRVDLVFIGDETPAFDKFRNEHMRKGESVPSALKALMKDQEKS